MLLGPTYMPFFSLPAIHCDLDHPCPAALLNAACAAVCFKFATRDLAAWRPTTWLIASLPAHAADPATTSPVFDGRDGKKLRLDATLEEVYDVGSLLGEGGGLRLGAVPPVLRAALVSRKRQCTGRGCVAVGITHWVRSSNMQPGQHAGWRIGSAE